VFEEETDYSSPDDALRDAPAKIKACFEWLGEFLAAFHRSAPYMMSWVVYPISMFDVGAIYHGVTAHSKSQDRWEIFGSAVSLVAGRSLHKPLFFMDSETGEVSTTPFGVAHELLAEAQMSLLRGMTRLAVVNSYTAVESLANAVFLQEKVKKFVSVNVPLEAATNFVEEERERHRTDKNFLFNSGMKDASGRSLFEENKSLYDGLLKLQQVRHKVAHTGFRPSVDDAKAAHRLCCEATRWLSDVAGFPSKELFPSEDMVSPGVSIRFKDAFAQDESNSALLRELLAALSADPNTAVEVKSSADPVAE